MDHLKHLKQLAPLDKLHQKFKNLAIHKLFHDVATEFNFIVGQIEMIDPITVRYLLDMGVDP